MELKLTDGKYVLGEYQGLESVSQGDVLLQRVLMRLKTPRGSFLPMPEYGSRLHRLSAVKPSERESAAKMYIAEALAEEKGLELTGLTIRDWEDGGVLLDMCFGYDGGSIRAQTTV